MKNPFTKDDSTGANTIPERPSKVALALWMLYLSLGIGVIAVFVTWLRFGFPGPAGYFLINVLMMIIVFQFQAPEWVMHGGLLSILIVPLAVWLYYMIGKGKNWARITILIIVILETVDFIMGVVISLSLPKLTRSTFKFSDFLASPLILQPALQIAAATLLYARVSSDWFKAIKIHHKLPRTKAKGSVIKLAVGALGLLIVIVVVWQIAGFFQEGPLIEAVRKNDMKQVQGLLEKGADINAKDSLGFPILVKAAEWGRPEIIKLLLNKGADVNTKTKGGRTALMNASWQGHSEVVKLLLDNGADINAKDDSGRTALMNASWQGQHEVVKLLLDNGADINAKDNNGSTALILSSIRCLRSHRGIVKLLLDNGADINAKESRGLTALIEATRRCTPEMVSLLLDNGADINAKDNNGLTALMASSSLGRLDVLNLLLEKGADINAKDNWGRTALMQASQNGHSRVVELLKAHGAEQ